MTPTAENQSTADFLASNWLDTVKHTILYKGNSLEVELEIKPSESIVQMQILPSHNNKLLAAVGKKLVSDEKFRGKLNPKKLENIHEVFKDESELMDYVMDDAELVQQMLENSNQDAVQMRETNKKIVMSCAINPKFTTHEDFKANQDAYLKGEPKTFPVEYISDFDMQTLAQMATGKHVVWEDKGSEDLGNFSLPGADREQSPERGVNSAGSEILASDAE